jgi:hypothetical protein
MDQKNPPLARHPDSKPKGNLRHDPQEGKKENRDRMKKEDSPKVVSLWDLYFEVQTYRKSERGSKQETDSWHAILDLLDKLEVFAK